MKNHTLNPEEPKDESLRKSLAWTEQQITYLDDESTPRPAAQSVTTPDTVSPSPDHIEPVEEAPTPLETTASTVKVIRLDALDIGGLQKAAGQYVIIQGYVQSVVPAVGRNQITFINFSKLRFQFKAVIHRNVLPVFTKVYGEDFNVIVGRMVEIEGILNMFGQTPQIVLNRPEQLRLLSATEMKIPVFSAQAVKDLRAYEGQNVSVEGRIVQVGATPDNSITFLDFEQEGPERFTAVIRIDYLERITKALGGHPSKVLIGRTVRVTGEIYHFQHRPNIEISGPGQIEIIHDP